jgi:hypothetical protein
MTRAVTAQVEQTVSAVPSLKLAVIVAASRSHDWHMLAPALLRLAALPSQSDGRGSVIRAGHSSSGGGEPAFAGD